MAASGRAHAQFEGSGEEKVLSSVADVLMKPVDDQKVVIRGRLVKELGDEKFTFTDETAEIRVDIDEELFQGQKVSESSIVEIEGEVEKDFMSTPEIDVKRLTIVSL